MTRGRFGYKIDIQFLYFVADLLLKKLVRIFDMVDIEHHQTAKDSIFVLALAALKIDCVRRDDGEHLFELGFLLFVICILLAEGRYSFAYLLYRWRIEQLLKHHLLAWQELAIFNASLPCEAT